ncbi:S41 family peptidase [Candidatus Saccharibacteria bacterium]|nr:S41 family peptidase [Candidatus Saccharibacteria bacterium]
MRVEKETLVGYEQANSSKLPRFAAFLLISIALVAGFLLGQKFHDFWLYGSFEKANLDYSSLDEIYNVLRNVYDGDINESDLIDGARRGMVAGLGDAYTEFFTSDEASVYFDGLEGSFEGIGAELGRVNEILTVTWVLDGSPAAKIGLQNGDIIAKVDGESSLDWAPEYAVTKIRGEAGTVVKLVIIRGQEAIEKAITREKINEPSVRYEIKDGNIGYLRISRFGATDTAELTRKAAREFVDKKVSGIVVDLRSNGGGYVTAARDVASLWLDKNEIIAVERGRLTPEVELYSTGQATLAGIKTVVLINDYTASASEILAGALRDGKKATLIGVRTYGKGVVQSIKPLSDGSQLKITSARWYTPGGTNIDHTGLKPDEEVEFDADVYQKSGRDNQLVRALELLK